ncbi:MAG: TlpA disulfide reductase family protein [Bacteroidota bacterium]
MLRNDTISIGMFAMICICMACNEEKVDYAIISGKVENAKEKIALSADYGTDNQDHVLPLAKDGSFKDTLYTTEGLYTIFDGQNLIEFYIQPSKAYIINYDADRFHENGIQLLGNDTLYNHYYTIKSQNRVFVNPTERTEEVEIRRFLNDIKSKQLEWLEASGLSEALKERERIIINYRYLLELLFCLYYAEITDPSPKTVEEFNIDYNNEKHYRTYGIYARLVSEHHSVTLQDIERKNQLEGQSYSLAQNAISYYEANISSELIKNDMIADNASTHLRYAEDKKALYEDFKTYYTGKDSLIKAKMLNQYLKLSNLVKGSSSPKFFNYKNYTVGTNSLDDFRGNYVYINLWATWCAACYGSMPALKGLAEDYQGKNITFVSIAWKDEELQWRKVIKEKELAGVQLFADAEDNSFFEAYGIDGLPRYILIDPQGNIVDPNAPSPKDENLATMLENIVLTQVPKK